MTFSLLSIFAAGLLTFASPCVLPLMPVYLATIAGSSLSAARRRRTLAVAFSFCLGLSVVFVTLGALASAVGALLVQYRTPIVIGSGGLMMAFGLRGLGLLRIPLLDRDARPGMHRVRTVSSVFGAFLFGAAFALGWSPCVGPVLASVLTYVATRTNSAWTGAGYLAVYAAGLSVPLLLLASVASQAGALIRHYRGLVPRLEKVTGLAMLTVGALAVASTLPTWSELQPETSLEAKSKLAPPSSKPATAPSSEPTTCELKSTAQGTCDLPAVASNDDSSAPALEAQHHAHASHLLEFTARECPVCRKMRPVIDKVAESCNELDNRVVRVDVSTARGRKLADQHAVRGTPTVLFLDERGVERARLVGERSEQELTATVESALELSCSADPAVGNPRG